MATRRTAKTPIKTEAEQRRLDAREEARRKHEQHERGVQWMLNSILVLSGGALIASAVYGLQYSLKGAILALLASALGYTIGGVSGFLFGFPRYTDSSAVSNAADLQAAAAASGLGKAATLRHNTNLERITDWLMTMIVGATLVNLQELVAWAEAQFRAITAAIVYSGMADFPDSIDTYSTPGAVLVLPLMAAGFLHMYMWARKFLLPEWLAQDKALQQEIANLEKKAETQQRALERSLYTLDSTYLARQEDLLLRMKVDQATVEDIVERYRSADSWNDDPFLEFGPPEADGFRLSAKVTKDEVNRYNPFRVDIKIERLDGAEFSGSIALLLHNSFRSPVIVEPVFRGTTYQQTISCADAFAAGAVLVLDEGLKNIRLGLDLSKLPNLPEGFVSDSAPEGPAPRTTEEA